MRSKNSDALDKITLWQSKDSFPTNIWQSQNFLFSKRFEYTGCSLENEIDLEKILA